MEVQRLSDKEIEQWVAAAYAMAPTEMTKISGANLRALLGHTLALAEDIAWAHRCLEDHGHPESDNERHPLAARIERALSGL